MWRRIFDLWLLRGQVVHLQQTITEAEDKVQQLERSERRLKERVAELQRSAEVRPDVNLLYRFSILKVARYIALGC